MAELMKKKGRCTNFDNKCPIADSNKIVEVDITDDFVCPECQSDLTEIIKKPFPRWILAVAGVVVLGGAGAGAWMMLGGESTAEPIEVATEIVLSQQACDIQIGDTVMLTAQVMPAEADASDIIWSSADERIASVDNGVVVALAEGETTITVQSPGLEISKQAVVSVMAKPAEAPQEVAEPAVETAKPAEAPQKVAAQAPAKPTGPITGRFTGGLKKGYPNGTGTLTFTTSRRIDLHDEKARTASAGDYIIGEWDNGHLVQGRWYDSANNLKETIVLGKAMNPEKDHSLGSCSK